MLWFMVLQMVSTLVELIQLRRTSASDKELEIVLLRRQLAICERKHRQPMRLTRGEKLTLVVLAVRLKARRATKLHLQENRLILRDARSCGFMESFVCGLAERPVFDFLHHALSAGQPCPFAPTYPLTLRPSSSPFRLRHTQKNPQAYCTCGAFSATA
jgi:hypothetical protein